MKKVKSVFGLVMIAAVAFVGSAFLFGANGNAYIDPSVMTYLIQVIGGIVIALGAAIGIYFRRAKKKLSEKLGIDENRNKEVESDDILIKEEATEEEHNEVTE